MRLDITDPNDVFAAAQRCHDVTLLINNAATLRLSALIHSPSTDAARQEMETNYFGTLAMCRAFAPILERNGGGALINMLSIVSFYNNPSIGSFCATKAALWSLTNGIRIELRQQGTLVVAVHSSFIDTELAAEITAAKHPPRDVAERVLDAVEKGDEEVLMDDRTRVAKAAIPRDLEVVYPEIERQYHASSG